MFALLSGEFSGGINVRIRSAAEDFPILVIRIELSPILAVFEPLVEPAIVHFPFANQEIKVTRRRCRRRCNF